MSLLLVFLFIACSSLNIEKQTNNSDKDRFIIKYKLDSTKIAATIKPSGYLWNTESHLSDVSRPLQHRDTTENLFPNAISPATQICFHLDEPDSIISYICNTDESSCIKIENTKLDSGSYCIGFQRLEIDGILVFKLITTDSTFTKKMIFIR